MFLSSQELRQIKHDYERLLKSPEACQIKIRYHRLLAGNTLEDAPIDVDVRAIHKTVDALDLKKLNDGILEVGDALFFISSSVSLSTPNGADAVVDGTLKVVDSAGKSWSPRVVDGGDKSRYVTYYLGGQQIGQVIVCHNEK